MQFIAVRRIALSTLIAAFLTDGTMAKSATASEDVARGHTKITGVVTKKAGALVVTTPGGATHQLNENLSRRHGHEPFKAGDEVIAVLDENNYIIDMHLTGHAIQHQFVTGTLIHLGMTNKQIKIHTSEGDKIFPLTEQAQKTKGFAEGTLVTIELNEAGAAIDVHQADTGGSEQQSP
ncbi:MAG: hypothetical protein NW703_13795 [Nitrospiraceae bacterium]